MRLTDIYVIRGADQLVSLEPLFWSYKTGYYGSLQVATIFQEEEVKAGKFNPPGKWVSLLEAMQARDAWYEDRIQDQKYLGGNT